MSDPIFATDIMSLLDIPSYVEGFPRQNAKLLDVIDYFKSVPNYRNRLLRVLAQKNGDKLDIAWTYVQLLREKEKAVKSLNPSDFEADVADEIVKGYISKDKIKTVKDDITERMKAAQKAEAEEAKQEVMSSKKTEKAISVSMMQEYSRKLSEIEKLNEELKAYE